MTASIRSPGAAAGIVVGRVIELKRIVGIVEDQAELSDG